MSVLKVENLSYRYEKTKEYVLKNVSAEFETGKLYMITGKSGSGKSTFLSLLSGLDRVKEGEGRILYQGCDLSGMNPDRYRAKEVGVIFQGFNLIRNYSAVENILLSQNISFQGERERTKPDSKKVLELLSGLGIGRETAGRKVMHISGGEQQRVAIARALSHDPEVLIADEPTGNLDKENARDIMNIFRRLAHEEKKCVIVVSHSEESKKYADEILRMDRGRLCVG